MIIYQRTVFFLITSPLVKRDYQRFGIELWIKRGWSVKVLDCTKFLKPEFFKYVKGERNSVYFEGLHIFNSKKSALEYVANIKEKCIFIDMLPINIDTIKLISTVQKKGATIKLQFKSTPIPVEFLTTGMRQKIQKLFTSNALDKLVQYFINKFEKYKIRSPDYTVVGGYLSEEGVISNTTKMIYAHHLDYDFFIENDGIYGKSSKKTIVYIDGDSVYHSDFVYSNHSSGLTEEGLYPIVNSTLLMLSNLFKMDVKVAAHPRADYDRRSYKYPFPFLINQTFELIQKSSIVISHGSVSLNWAVIMRKPIIIITTNDIKDSLYGTLTEKFADSLGKEVINIDIDNDINWSQHLHVDEAKYTNYIKKYIKQKKSEERLVWDIVIDRMESDFFFINID